MKHALDEDHRKGSAEEAATPNFDRLEALATPLNFLS